MNACRICNTKNTMYHLTIINIILNVGLVTNIAVMYIIIDYKANIVKECIHVVRLYEIHSIW
jgi:hypothetical protein